MSLFRKTSPCKLGSTPPLRTCALEALERAHRAREARRPHVPMVKLRLQTGAPRHDEGNDRVRRSLHSGTRAPSVRRRHCLVSIVAEAHGVGLHPSRRHVSRNT